MVAVHIQFWRGQECLFERAEEAFGSLDAVTYHIHGLIREMMSDDHQDDWTGCHFRVTTAGGRSVMKVPVLPTMSAIARQAYH